MNFDTVLSIFLLFFFIDHTWEQVMPVQAIHPWSIMGQLNVQAATAENEELYTLSNIIYIVFQNSYSFPWTFPWEAVVFKS